MNIPSLRCILALAGVAGLCAPVVAQNEKKAEQPSHQEVRVMKGGPRAAADEPAQPVTFLGIHSAPADATLAAQLGFPQGSGVVVVTVLKDSPAHDVLQPHDILLKFDDQILVNPPQLGVLVRSRQAGDEVTLTVLRQGQRQQLKVTLAERTVPRLARRIGAAARLAEGLPAAFPPEEMDHLLTMLPEAPAHGFSFATGERPFVRFLDIGRSEFVFSDEEGAIEVSGGPGDRRAVVKDKDGKVLFDGPIGSPEQRDALPEHIRQRIRHLDAVRVLRGERGQREAVGPAEGRDVLRRLDVAPNEPAI